MDSAAPPARRPLERIAEIPNPTPHRPLPAPNVLPNAHKAGLPVPEIHPEPQAQRRSRPSQ
jgi:hypothetical protein